MTDVNQNTKFQALIEDYKMINTEVSAYQNEMIRCFLYAVAILAIGLGYGAIEDKVDKIIDYMPIALAGLTVYFLTLGTMFVIANRYKAQIETRLNKLADEPLFEYESVYKPKFLRFGLLPNAKGKRRFPLPNILLGLMMAGAFLFLTWQSNVTRPYFWWFCAGGIFIGLLCAYVFILIPMIIEKNQEKSK